MSYNSLLFNASTVNSLVENGFYIGVDVGTGSARACIIDSFGTILALSERPIIRQEIKPDYITQSSTEIWDAVCYTVRNVVRDSSVDPSLIYGIGFDATCSLTVINKNNDDPIAVGPDFQNPNQNIILWMDHRAVEETKCINSTNYKGLKYVGGQMSIEMEIPKIKWLKNNMPTKQFESSLFFDLPDFLVYKATKIHHRSYCSTVCKQGLLPLGVEDQSTGWSAEFFNAIDLQELIQNDFEKLGGSPNKSGNWFSAGQTVGPLSSQAASELGLTTNCFVGSGVIDCYSGWIGTIAGKTDIPIEGISSNNNTHSSSMKNAIGRLAAVAGTSTCHCVMSNHPIFVNGVWGPYRDIMAPGYWLAEGGQSLTGALLAHVITSHPAHAELSQKADAADVSKFDYLNSLLEQLRVIRKARSVVSLAKHFFLYGDFHGNRSPIADPDMRANIIGQSMDTSLEDLAVTYLGACEFIAQQTRQIVESMITAGHTVNAIFMSGGQCRNGLLMRLLADCVGIPVVIPRYIDAAVVFGSAILGAVAAESVPKELKRSNSRNYMRTRSSSQNLHQPYHLSSQIPNNSIGSNNAIVSNAHAAAAFSARAANANNGEPLNSPYAFPTAASSSNIAATTAIPNILETYPFPLMTPMAEEEQQEIGKQSNENDFEVENAPVGAAPDGDVIELNDSDKVDKNKKVSNMPEKSIFQKKKILAGGASDGDDDDEFDNDEEEIISFGATKKFQEAVASSNNANVLNFDNLRISRKKSVSKKLDDKSDELWKVMERLTGPGRVVSPSGKDDPDRKLLDVKYTIFLDMSQRQREYRRMVDRVEAINTHQH